VCIILRVDNKENNVGSRDRIKREKEQRREAIIKAAEKLFIKKGFEGTIMDEIARKCDLSKGALYLYFSTKEQLYQIIIHRAISEMFELVKHMQVGIESPIERLRMVGEAYLRFYETHPDHFMILLRTSDHSYKKNVNDPELKRIYEKHTDVWTLITEIISDGIKDGTFRKDTNPIEIAISLYATSTMIIQLMDHHKRNQSIPDDDIFFNNIDFVQLYKNIGRRTILSILENPPAQPEEMEGFL